MKKQTNKKRGSKEQTPAEGKTRQKQPSAMEICTELNGKYKYKGGGKGTKHYNTGTS